MAARDDTPDPAGLAAIAAVMATGFGSQPGPAAGRGKQTADAITFRPREWPLPVAARLTAFDPALGHYAWVERTWDQYGNRADKPRGLFGSAAYNPAVRVGTGGRLPVPLDVILWRRLRAIGSGSGGGGIGIVWEIDVGDGAGDRVEIVEPHNSAVTPPDVYLTDGRVRYANLGTTPISLDVGEDAWLLDVNELP